MAAGAMGRHDGRMWKPWPLVATLALVAAGASAADFGVAGGAAPANIDEVAKALRQDPYDLELLISFGTSKGGSAGHLALAIRDRMASDDAVYSANFYADRTLTKSPITPADQAEAFFLLFSPRLSKTTGQVITVDGGLTEAFLR